LLSCDWAAGSFKDTGIREHLPKGRGLLPFHDIEEAAAAVAAVDGDSVTHARAARQIAETYLDGTRVFRAMPEAT
jgi:hypothetical protein